MSFRKVLIFVLAVGIIIPKLSFSQNQCPGITVVGRGYNVFGEYANNKSVKEALFNIGTYEVKPMDDGQEYKIPSLLNLKYINEKNYNVTEGRSLRQYAESMSASVGISYKGLFFKASMQSRFGSEKSSQSSNYFYTITDWSRIWEVSINPFKAKNLRQYLKPEVKEAIDTWNPNELFELAGTHFITSGYFGGAMEFNLSESFNSEEQAKSVSVSVQAKYKRVSGSSDFNFNNKSVNENFASNVKIYARGGDVQYANKSVSNDNSQYNMWVKSIPAKSVLVDFKNGSLVPIWTLAETQTRRNELEVAFKKLLAKYPLPEEIANKMIMNSLYYIKPETNKNQSWDLPGFHFDAKEIGSNITLGQNGTGADRFYKIVPVDNEPEYVYLQPQNAHSIIASTGTSIRTESKQNNDSQKFKMIEVKKDVYLLQNKASGMFLTKQGNSIIQKAKSESPEQQWYFQKAEALEMAPPPIDQLVVIKNLAAGKFVDVYGYPGNQKLKGEALKLNNYDSHIDHFFYTEKVSSNKYLIRICNEGKVFDLTSGNTNTGNTVGLWDEHRHESQLFTFEYSGKPRTYYIKSIKSGTYLEVEKNLAQAANSNIVLGGKDKSAGERMQWEIIPMKWNKQILSNKAFHIRAAYSDFVMDIGNAENRNGATIGIWDNLKQNHQKFKFIPTGDGWYFIEAQNGGRYFDIPYGKADNDLGVTIYDRHGGKSQKYKLVPTSDYTFAIITKTSDNPKKALTVFGGNPKAKGQKVVQYSHDYGLSQHWVLLKSGTNTPIKIFTVK